MNIRDIVISKPESNFVLACGSGRYAFAVVANMNPFTLISEYGDMLWQDIEPEYFRSIGTANEEIFGRVMKRWQGSRNKRAQKECEELR